MTERVSAVLRVLGEIVAEPTANLTSAMLLLSVLTIILLILIVLAAFFLIPSEDDDEDEGTIELGDSDERQELDGASEARQAVLSGSVIATGVTSQPSEGPRVLARGYAWVGIALLMGASILAYGTTSTDSYCLTCHAELRLAESADGTSTAAVERSTHTTVRCVACHETAPPTGLASSVSTRAQHLAARITGIKLSGTPVDSEACLRCHRSIETTVSIDATRGIRMSHAEPVAAGMTCTGCHGEVAHGADQSQTPSMSACVRCHDGVAVSSECSLCHIGDVADASSSRLVYAPLDLAPVSDCGGCHAQDTCDACHGLRMPHSQSFLDGEHAREAGFDKKVLCWRCHTLTDCGRCHQTKDRALGYWGHGIGPGWKQLHGEGMTVEGYAGCGCHGRSPYARAGHYCKACH